MTKLPRIWAKWSADHLLWQADHPLCKMMVSGLSLGQDLVGGVPQVPTKLSANFGEATDQV